MDIVEAIPVDCIECYCPYCGKKVVETGFDVRDMTAPDFEEETEIDCPHCTKTFIAKINRKE